MIFFFVIIRHLMFFYVMIGTKDNVMFVWVTFPCYVITWSCMSYILLYALKKKTLRVLFYPIKKCFVSVFLFVLKKNSQ